jgi:hypothetical protein
MPDTALAAGLSDKLLSRRRAEACVAKLSRMQRTQEDPNLMIIKIL